jgi:hypothetical protein
MPSRATQCIFSVVDALAFTGEFLCIKAFPAVCVSNVSTDRGEIAIITQDEARAAIEAQLFPMKLTKPLSPVKKMAFCAVAGRRLEYLSKLTNTGRLKDERRLGGPSVRQL